MDQWIKLLKATGKYKVGELVKVPADVAKAYVDAGMAEDGGKGPDDALEAVGTEELKKALKGYNDGVADAFKAMTEDLKKSLKGHTIIEPGDQQADKTKGLGDFVQNIVKSANINNLDGCRDAQERLVKVYGSQMKKGMEESTGSAGGFWTTPVQFEKTILKEAWEEAVIEPGTTKVPLSARAVEWPALDQYKVPTKGNSAQFGGVTVSRKGENSTRDRTQPAGTTVKLEANDLTAFTQYSRDLQEDSSMLESMLVELIGGAIGFRVDWEQLFGTGEGMCLGIMACKALIKIKRQAAKLVEYLDVATMLGRLTPSGRKRAVWICHPYHETSLMTMTDPSGRYIYIPNWPGSQEGPAQVNPTPKLANLPVLFSEKMAAPGTPGDFLLADRKAYLSGTRAGLEIGLSEHFLFDSDQIALRAKIRNDGQPWVKKPFTLADGAGTNLVSPFVSLDVVGTN